MGFRSSEEIGGPSLTNPADRCLFDDCPDLLTQADGSGDNGRMPTVAEAIDFYLANMPIGAIQADKEKRQKLLLFKADLGNLPLETCKPRHLKNWIALHPGWLSPWTLRRIKSTIQGAFNYCIDPLGFIERNPFAGRIKYALGPEGKPMEDKLFQLYLRESSAIFRRPLIFIKYTGCRPCEMANAEWDDLDMERCAIVLYKHKTSHKTPRPRTIILHPTVVRLLIWLRRRAGVDGDRIFLNKWARPWKNTTICQRLKVIRKKHGIPKARTLYGLRHGFACNAIKNGVDLATLATLMGHADVNTTRKYVHLAGDTEHLQEAVKKIARRKPTWTSKIS